MTSREQLQFIYELAFYPPRLNQIWDRINKGKISDPGKLEELGRMLDAALTLHLALPESGYASQQALNRLAIYQAKSRAFGNVCFLRNIRNHLRRPPIIATEVPAHMVRDIGLPPLCHPKNDRAGRRQNHEVERGHP